MDISTCIYNRNVVTFLPYFYMTIESIETIVRIGRFPDSDGSLWPLSSDKMTESDKTIKIGDSTYSFDNVLSHNKNQEEALSQISRKYVDGFFRGDSSVIFNHGGYTAWKEYLFSFDFGNNVGNLLDWVLHHLSMKSFPLHIDLWLSNHDKKNSLYGGSFTAVSQQPETIKSKLRTVSDATKKKLRILGDVGRYNHRCIRILTQFDDGKVSSLMLVSLCGYDPYLLTDCSNPSSPHIYEEESFNGLSNYLISRGGDPEKMAVAECALGKILPDAKGSNFKICFIISCLSSDLDSAKFSLEYGSRLRVANEVDLTGPVEVEEVTPEPQTPRNQNQDNDNTDDIRAASSQGQSANKSSLKKSRARGAHGRSAHHKRECLPSPAKLTCRNILSPKKGRNVKFCQCNSCGGSKNMASVGESKEIAPHLSTYQTPTSISSFSINGTSGATASLGSRLPMKLRTRRACIQDYSDDDDFGLSSSDADTGTSKQQSLPKDSVEPPFMVVLRYSKQGNAQQLEKLVGNNTESTYSVASLNDGKGSMKTAESKLQKKEGAKGNHLIETHIPLPVQPLAEIAPPAVNSESEGSLDPTILSDISNTVVREQVAATTERRPVIGTGNTGGVEYQVNDESTGSGNSKQDTCDSSVISSGANQGCAPNVSQPNRSNGISPEVQLSHQENSFIGTSCEAKTPVNGSIKASPRISEGIKIDGSPDSNGICTEEMGRAPQDEMICEDQHGCLPEQDKLIDSTYDERLPGPNSTPTSDTANPRPSRASQSQAQQLCIPQNLQTALENNVSLEDKDKIIRALFAQNEALMRLFKDIYFKE